MHLVPESLLIAGSFLLFLSIVITKLSTRLGIPALIIFLLVGMAAGHEQLGNIDFHNPIAAQLLGAITLSLILFTGGIETEYKHIRPILWNGILLATVGILITTFSVGLFIWGVTAFWGGNIQFTLLEGLLMGSIVASTDAAAVFAIIRAKNMHLKANLSPMLELESGSNDTMAWFLMILFKTLLLTNQAISPMAAIFTFIQEMVVGGLAGVLVGKIMLLLLENLRLANRSLYPGLMLAVVIFTYSATHFLHGNAFLAVYLVGLILGNKDFAHKKSIIQFCQGISWLMQIIMFITLGLLVYPAKLLPIAGIGLLLSIFLMFVARPLSVFVSLFFSKTLNVNHKIFISWVGLRGAVPIVFATYPLLDNIHQADVIYHIVFFVVLTSILFQGTTLSPLAKWLQLEAPAVVKREPSIQLSKEVDSELIEVMVPEDAPAIGKKIVQLSFPENTLIVLIKRNGVYVIPRGDTVIAAFDLLMIMAEQKQAIHTIKEQLGIVH
ncbi:MAG: potassium/proton antiporter [Candidatus Cardinium sp.]|uniref:potassium/proton antiporter n=1 Tax=Cardinium endosymbiont of Dermatophagoides farinae TaxID=2597823 RepID=UPI001183ADDA|nr:potassium/proton antiporter [Cardinium endosymbiont of Dermatophagoides farinae]TSJ80960.1 potassium/proton antiporter [Cardinium endosymbiont of Dermatophagoides farinae]UWW96986.1 MAG: potassium/proton antiporter [Candidatus Cardinium sp.]